MLVSVAHAQSVGLPEPRLLTTFPMGGRVGTQVEVIVSGENLEDAEALLFSNPRLTATRKLNAAGQPEPDRYIVTIAADCPPGLYEARMLTRLGISSSRVFSVGTLEEVAATTPIKTLATAIELPLNSVCNAVTTPRGVNYHRFQAQRGERIIVDCATRGIDSKLDAVVIIADEKGRDLLVERRGGVLDYTIPADGKYVVKVHELTYQGGAPDFYRLAIRSLPIGESYTRLPTIKPVNSFFWPPTGLPSQPALIETEPNNDGAHAQRITIPCDLAGAFGAAADVDVFEFEATAGDEWWVEVGSERMGLPTDPAVVVQRVQRNADGTEQLTDVAEFSDIPSPIKVSSNFYSYDGPPYNAGSTDILGKLTIKETGTYRLQLTDLFGGTRQDPRNVYRLVIRRPAPDFAVVAWPLHFELRNGDRAALSRPMALRGGATVAYEVIVQRRDGFAGEIDLGMDGLPEGVTAHGLRIPAGQSRGLMLLSADQNAPRAVVSAKFFGRGKIGDAAVTRPGRVAVVTWPIADHWHEVPKPRLSQDVPVSVSGHEFAPITIRAATSPVIETQVGTKLTIPLAHLHRSDFSAATMSTRTIGAGFEGNPLFNLSVTDDSSQATLDLAALGVKPGEYTIAFVGGAVAKYRHRLDLVSLYQQQRDAAQAEVQKIDAELERVNVALQAAAVEQQTELKDAAAAITAKKTAAATALQTLNDQLKRATDAAQPRDIVDIVVSEPITIRVSPAESK